MLLKEKQKGILRKNKLKMTTLMDSAKLSIKEAEKCLDPQLWHACAGGMVQMPPVNSKVFYFPQGHAEHASGRTDFGRFPRIPSLILCRVSAIMFKADPETDEVYAKLRLVPLRTNDCDFDEDGFDGSNGIEGKEKPASFAKTLTQSDANNGGGFSVPRYCAETIFPRLDYTADPPVQTILVKDVHGEIWKFRHIYRGTPRRHLLTTGWSNFVNQKKLVAGDSIVFLRAENGDLCVGIQRAKRGMVGGVESPSGWNPTAAYSIFNEDRPRRTNSSGDLKGNGRVKIDSVIEAANLAANGKPFEVVYYPRASTPEFCVKASSVRAAMRIHWSGGMRFKMAFETEDCSRISWFMGTISSVQVADTINWPNSPWRVLQVTWDEPDLLQNVKAVSPWLVELVSNMPAIHFSSMSSPPRKKLRLPQHPDFPLVGQFLMSPFSNNPLRPSNPLCCLSDTIPAGIQGARHAQFGPSSSSLSSDLRNDKLQSGLFPVNFQHLDYSRPPSRIPTSTFMGNPENSENLSCLLTMGSSPKRLRKTNEIKATPVFVLFGQPILTEEQMSQTSSGDTVLQSSDSSEKTTNFSDGSVSGSQQNGPVENSDEGSHWSRNLDSYGEVHQKLAKMFGIGGSDARNNAN